MEEKHEYSRDALRLLYAIGAYTNPSGDFSDRHRIKMHRKRVGSPKS